MSLIRRGTLIPGRITWITDHLSPIGCALRPCVNVDSLSPMHRDHRAERDSFHLSRGPLIDSGSSGVLSFELDKRPVLYGIVGFSSRACCVHSAHYVCDYLPEEA